MTYSNFADKMLLALYQETASGEEPLIALADLMSRYGLTANESWLIRLTEDWEQNAFAKVVRGSAAPEWQVEITGKGMREIERSYGGDVADRRILEPLPAGVTQIDPRFFTSDGPAPADFKGREGDVLIELGANSDDAEMIPASDRMVSLDHNSAPYQQVKEGLAELREQLRTANDLDCAPEERDRVLASLTAAQRLWDAAQLKIIQIKVGIIITIEDAVSLLAKVGKAAGKAALIDAVKWIVKHATGVEL